ncbi:MULTISPECIES: filamentous haemagglutinin family protein [Paraburkholderia]|uniref:filamentous haemagglutinin family protein n=1 Tax=Paraburkholderia TaxID=1822464 RepID=UPI0022560D86|nr:MULTISPECIES: filamentous haemagglutinin family protein [Paraburkholderia]MCX4161663.1 filamentous hemagglutinin family protein [Paraburkholderia megapolitana]MDN7157160.1 filamentous hemagglutinin family protein [Paraburkholderia sp. CHISQ3]MDQ6494205.1 filamentous hemagglutinin family protein [Paraburkholderia megapolitana]
MLAVGFTAQAHAAGIVNLGQATARSISGGAGGAGVGVPNLGVSPQQALQASQPSIRNLGTAAQAIASQIAAQQSAAAAAAATASNVPNGLTPGGLQVAPGITFENQGGNLVSQNTDPTKPLLWINAYGPTQTVASNGHVNVNVQQTAQNAVLTWQTMNVGRQTTLNFDQSAGTQTNGANNWAVLNRINDPSGRPSQILGNMTAQGAVYVINRNGILFGAGSQINVHSLVASSLSLLDMNNEPGPQSAAGIATSNQLFLNVLPGASGGLANPEAGSSNNIPSAPNVPNEILGLGAQAKPLGPYQAPGDITIQPGASITTHTNGNASDGGFVMVAAPNVTNGGSITATAGQVVLAAGVGVSVTPNKGATNNPQVLLPELSGQVISVQNGSNVDITPAGTLTNTGIVQAARGTVNLLGSRVEQNGVVGVTTSVNAPGTINISTVDEYDSNNPLQQTYPGFTTVVGNGPGVAINAHRAGLLTFGPGSVTAVMPDDDGQTATSTPGTVFTPGGITMTAASVWFQGGSLIEAPGSTVSVNALTQSLAGYTTPVGQTAVPGRIYVDDGAIIDVSGIANTELPIAQTLVTIPLIGQNELADSPLLRSGFLFGLKNVVVDSTLTGTNSNGLQWVGSPILNLSGYVSLIPRTVDQLLVNGGTIILSGNEVMTASGSTMNLNGGYVHYDGGMVNTTRLVDANGAIVPIGQASPYDTYVGVAGEFVENHPRWQVTKTWYNPLTTGGVYEPDYIVGGNAGTLDLYATQSLVLDGTITAEAFGGSKQTQGNSLPTGGTFNLGSDPKLAAGTLINLTQNSPAGAPSGEFNLVVLQDTAPQLDDLAPGFSIDTSLNTTALNALPATDPDNILATMVVPVDTLNSGGFATLNVTGDKSLSKGFVVAEGTKLNLQPGGSVTLSAAFGNSSTTIAGELAIPSGKVTISSGSNITVTPTGQINVAGQWVNNDVDAAPGTTPGNSQYVNGGSISLAAGGHLDLQTGSVLDVSSGGEMQPNGQLLMSNGIPVGKGGSVSLLTSDNYLRQLPSDPFLSMNGTIRSFGFSGGGTLTLGAAGFQIGGDAVSAPVWDVVLPADFFAQQGFGNYVLNALYDSTVAPGTTVSLTQQNLIPNAVSLQQAASGADLTTAGLTSVGTLDAYHRQPTGLAMTGGGYLNIVNTFNDAGVSPPTSIATPPNDGAVGTVSVGQGASIVADAGASIGLGSPVQVTVLGSLIAPGGSIMLSAEGATGARYTVPGQVTINAGYTSSSKSVWLGPNAVLDVSGIALTNPLAAPVKSGSTTFIPDTGKVLRGGSVTIADDAGYIVAQAGSKINVSGASTSFDQAQANGTYASQPVWSDAGSITLAASSGLFFDGTLSAQPGASGAQGGTLTLLPVSGATSPFLPDGTQLPYSLPGATSIVLQQSGNFVPAGLAPGQSILAAAGVYNTVPKISQDVLQPTGVLQFAADRLTGSGIGTLVLGDSTSLTPVPVAFAGDVNVVVSKAVQIYANQIVALSSGELQSLTKGEGSKGNYSIPTISTLMSREAPSQTSGQSAPPPITIGSTVTIDAPYVAVVAPTQTDVAKLGTVAAASDATLNVNASFIDLENQIQINNFEQTNFTSSGDIRLSSTSPGSSAIALQSGELYTPGNLTFRAADLYPSTGSTFILSAVGPTDPTTGNPTPTTITFASNGTSGVPLSAGGTLLVDASTITQGGTVRAPSGTLVFGVGDPGNAATQTQFNGLPLVATSSVTFADGSVTSVSNGNTIIPYGTTVDGVEWQFNPVAGTTLPDVTAPPSKYIGVNGSSVALNKGATIDLSGGGDLQAAEWVPGTGGTRDVLSQYNVSYASNAAGVAVPVNVGATNVYAILPGAQSPVAAYDPMFAQTLQPSNSANATVGTQTTSLGIGQAGTGGAIGQSVYLSGVPGLAAGYYTLLPGKYATLPDAYRVTVSGTTGTTAPGATQVLADGTVVTSGYFANALTGSRSATPTLFNVQSSKVWQQYSTYTLTSANSFFPALAATSGNVAPPLPVDGGQLVLAATKALTLGATLNTTAGAGGAPAEVDIASQDIQITGNGSAALPGYLQIGASDLDSLNAGSLLIGGTRTATTSGITIAPIADSVVVSNNASSALTGPEILLVTKTVQGNTDPNATNGLQVDSGATITASGSYPAAKDEPIAIAGDGALLRVSNGAMMTVTRTGTSGTGLLTVGAGATLTGGQALTLDSSGNLTVDPTAVLSAKAITVDGSAITFTGDTGAAAVNLPGFVLDAAGVAQLASAQQVILRSAGAINFIGNVNATFGNSVDLSAGTFASSGGTAVLNAQQIAFTNETGATSATTTPGTGTLTVNGKEIDFGTGNKNLSGFGSVTMNATGGIVGQNTGTFDFGALPVTLNAPLYLADTSSASTVKTTGLLSLNNVAGTALARSPVGGAWSFIGGTIADNGATIDAPAGNVSMEATTGNLTIGSGATVSSVGVSKQFFDTTQYAPAGAITLTADAGSVDVQAGSTLNFSGASGGGAAGSLTLSAPQQVVNLNGALKGGAASGNAGGSFSLNTGGAANLDSLAQTLASSGVNQSVTVHTKSGNLTLSPGNTLTAQTVSLTADGGAGNASDTANGNVNILGIVDASGAAGGEIDLYGRSGVDVEGKLLARATNTSQRGGKVDIGTSAVFDPSAPGSSYNATYGYENVGIENSGKILLGGSATIDVSGGTTGGPLDGTVNFRAPLLKDGTVNVMLTPPTKTEDGIKGSRATTVEAYAVWSTTDATSGAQHFDASIDPAGWYDDSGHLLAGTFTVPGTTSTKFTYTPNGAADGGGTLTNTTTGVSAAVTESQLKNGISADGFAGLTGDYFAATTPNADHTAFYGYLASVTTTDSNGNTTTVTPPGTLMGFVQKGVSSVANQFVGAQVANLNVVPGIELDNPSMSINSGNISVLSNWNLGAGSANNSGTITPDFRYQNTIAPTLTFRAANNFVAYASITDGFFQNQVATILGATGTGAATGTYAAAEQQFEQLVALDDPTQITLILTNNNTTTLASLDPDSVLSAPLKGQVAGYYTAYASYAGAWQQDVESWKSPSRLGLLLPPTPSVKPAPDASDVASYPTYSAYLSAYSTYIFGYNLATVTLFGTPTPITPPAAPLPTNDAEKAAKEAAAYLSEYASYISAYQQTYLGKLGVKSARAPRNSVNLSYAPIVPVSIPDTGTVNIGTLPGNAAANVATANNPLPIAYAALLGGQSSSYRIVSGADLDSANPLALEPVATFSNTDAASGPAGSVTLSGHTSYIDSNGQTLVQPVTIRTGTGSIDVASAVDISLYDKSIDSSATDAIVPGVIYAGGAPTQSLGLATAIVSGGSGHTDILVTPSVNPDSAGDVTVQAQRDITGLEYTTDTTGAQTGQVGANTSQFWWQWMEITATPTINNGNSFVPLSRSSIDFGAFDQGIMSVGGNVSISAGAKISDLAASLPTTWYLDGNGKPVTVGGGNLTVRAGGDILSGDYFVARGTGTITAGGQIGSDFSVPSPQVGPPVVVATLLATQDGVLNVNARQGANIGGVFDPSYVQSNPLLLVYHQYADGQGYSQTSAVNVSSTTGEVVLGSLGAISLIGGGATGTTPGTGDLSFILPATVNVTAFTGGISIDASGELYPSASGNLNLIAGQSIDFSSLNGLANSTGSGSGALPVFGMLDEDPSAMPSPTSPQAGVPLATEKTLAAHDASALHADDTTPVRIYSLNGSITNGILEAGGGRAGLYKDYVTLAIDKPALIQAGQDIVNLAFQGQNLRQSDITRIVAGRDIYDATFDTATGTEVVTPALILGGPGTFDIEAGRNIGPLTTAAQASGAPSGIDAVGNANNPNLPHESADINVLFGVGPGVDVAAFVSTYVDPASSVTGVPSATNALITFMQQYEAGQTVDTGLTNSQPTVQPLTAADAWSKFKALPQYVQQLFAEQVLFSVLTQVGEDYNNQASKYYQQYARGYDAINTLFPASLGYTANNLSGGSNGANKPVSTGNLDMRSTTIQTQQGGNISILGPGGEALVGSTTAPPQVVDNTGKVIAGPSSMGILTLEQGNINIFTDQSVQLAQSRIFTEQGGNLTIWSSNGDINAGKGAKTSADTPAPQYVCDANHYCTVDARGEVTGAGIATLQSVPGTPPGNANLIAPRGTVDAGDAGIRVSGNLNVAALHVANVDNIQVQGASTGIPVVQAVNTGALTAASSAASAASQMAQDIVKNSASGVGQRRWTISVQVEGFGDSNDDNAKKRKREQVGYDSSSAVSILGFGQVAPNRQAVLSSSERERLGKI